MRSNPDKAAEPREAPCRSTRCRMPVLWVMSASTGKWVPLSKKTGHVLNLGERPKHGEMVVTVENLTRTATEMDYGRKVYLSHWADCKDRGQFRKKQKGKKR